MNFKKVFFILINVFPIFYSLYLSHNQWNSIQTILQNRKISLEMRTTINKILFCAYENFAINQAYTFKKYHKQKCYNININDLILSSKLGLYKSVKKYKGASNFENYSRVYIQGELYKCLTDFHEINNIPKNIRKKRKSCLTFMERRKYNKGLKTSFVSTNDYWRFDKIQLNRNNNQNLDLNLDLDKEYSESEKRLELWTKLNNYFQNDSFSIKNKSIFLLKYDVEFNVIRSNANISQIVGCSEENIRLILKKIKKELYPFLFTNNSSTNN